MSFKMRSTRSLGPKHCQLPTIVRRVVLSTVTRVFKKRSISQSRELKPLEGNFHFKTLMGTTFSHEKSLQSVLLVHRGCHEHFRTQALSTYNRGVGIGETKSLGAYQNQIFHEKPLEGDFHNKTLMGTTFCHEKSLQSVFVHRGCHENYRTQALSTYYIQGRRN